MDKVIVILGPTSSGKSSLGIKLAKKFHGEIISADSRQVYTGMDLGTGKVTKQEQKQVPHHLLDVASPKRQFTAAHFKKLAKKSIQEIVDKQRLPFIVGGTAFYIYCLVDDLEIPSAKPDLKIRKALEAKTTAQLIAQLKELDPARLKTIDTSNRRRLIRALEINLTTGKPVPQLKVAPAYDALFLGISKPQDILYPAINQRLAQRLKQGIVKEVQKLLKSGLSHKKLQSFGLEYKYVSLYLQGKIEYDQMVLELEHAIHHFAKRQMTWFKRDKRIHWISKQSEAEKLIKQFLSL